MGRVYIKSRCFDTTSAHADMKVRAGSLTEDPSWLSGFPYVHSAPTYALTPLLKHLLASKDLEKGLIGPIEDRSGTSGTSQPMSLA